MDKRTIQYIGCLFSLVVFSLFYVAIVSLFLDNIKLGVFFTVFGSIIYYTILRISD